MRLRKAQEIFAFNIAQLILIIFRHQFSCTMGEAHRPPETAQLYAKQGRGIVGSQHCKKLALDINLFYKGKYLRATRDHKVFGDIWESMHPNNKWGGNFKRPDGNHYEMGMNPRREK